MFQKSFKMNGSWGMETIMSAVIVSLCQIIRTDKKTRQRYSPLVAVIVFNTINTSTCTRY